MNQTTGHRLLAVVAGAVLFGIGGGLLLWYPPGALILLVLFLAIGLYYQRMNEEVLI